MEYKSNSRWSRLGEFTENVNSLKAKIVVLSETKLDEAVPNSVINIPGFHEPIRKTVTDMVEVASYTSKHLKGCLGPRVSNRPARA